MSDEVIVNGIRIGPETDLRALLKQQLLGGSTLAGRYDESPEEGIWSVFTAAKGTAIEPRLIQAVLTLLADDDYRVRSGAVNLAQAFAAEFQSSDLLGVFDSFHKAHMGVGKSPADQALTWRLLRAIAGSENWTPQVKERIRSAALDPQNGLSVLAGLVNHDPDWVIEHAQEIIQGQLARAEVILFRMKDQVLRERLVRAIPRESPSLSQLMALAVSKEISDETEKGRLLKFLKDS